MKLVSLTLTQYSREPSGSFSFFGDGISITIPITAESAERLSAVAYDIFNEHKAQMAEDLLATETPTLLGYDESKTIEADDDTPF